MIGEQLKNVDAVCEILDARIPRSSRNPDIDGLTAGRPRLVVLNRADQADREATKDWAAFFKEKGWAVLETDCPCRPAWARGCRGYPAAQAPGRWAPTASSG